MRKLIYQAEYSTKPKKSGAHINYDDEYNRHEKIYSSTAAHQSHSNRPRSQSITMKNIKRDKFSGQKYHKFENIWMRKKLINRSYQDTINYVMLLLNIFICSKQFNVIYLNNSLLNFISSLYHLTKYHLLLKLFIRY